jgi:deazaflavin-dependent oxidoreductase (nitroreductase family)
MSLESRVLRTHQAIYEVTRGVLGHRLIGVPTLLLTTTGRRTGSRRTAALVYAKDDDGTLVVTASNGGADRAPGWLHNVRADASIGVQLKRDRFDGRAQVVGPKDAEYERLWALVNDNSHGRYERYQSKTDRPIELVKLRRRSSANDGGTG